jgi:ubiquitin-protein ligase
MAALANRMAHELRVLAREPPEGVSVAPPADGEPEAATTRRLSATLQGPPGTVYEGGWFRVSVVVPER